ncbi:MAG: glycosyltransferase [Burkholderiaceae bacterium]|jgi:glycosyltransferase involved in cell wall biosynthesis|nr:glycosyltransferase [Burkholderiaceae bacterium]
MIAIVVPAHNESQRIGRCLSSLQQAARCPRLGAEPVRIFVVADACTDATARIAEQQGAEVLPCQARSVGVARALGANAALAAGARWLAFTDADSVVAEDWIAQQLAQGCDAVCGTVQVDNWRAWGRLRSAMRAHFAKTYVDADGHRHIHGANLGVSAVAYRRAGGFAALASSEDVALVQALQDSGARIAWSAAPRVRTSARKRYRAPGGFGATLAQVARQSAPLGPVAAQP